MTMCLENLPVGEFIDLWFPYYGTERMSELRLLIYVELFALYTPRLQSSES